MFYFGSDPVAPLCSPGRRPTHNSYPIGNTSQEMANQ